LALPAAISLATDRAVLTGMAKPAAACWSEKRTFWPAVSMPMTWPAALTSGPPESPDTMPASVWNIPCSVSEVTVPPWSLAVMVLSTPVMRPGAETIWLRPSALPRAVTASPTLTLLESPSGTWCRPDGFCSWISAMSPVTSYPTTLAWKFFPVAATVALILVEFSMTWLLVSTRPLSALITMPVPAARSLLFCSVVLMMTTPCPTLVRLPPAPLPSTAVPEPSSGGNGAAGSLTKVGQGVVIINTTLQYSSERAAGTGMVINADKGLVLTNNHVIENSTKISATVAATGKNFQARVVGYDVTGDIALIQLQNPSGLHQVPLGDSSKVKVGDAVTALGNAQGRSQIVSAPGRITGVDKTITASDQGGAVTSETLHGMLQTDA